MSLELQWLAELLPNHDLSCCKMNLQVRRKCQNMDPRDQVPTHQISGKMTYQRIDTGANAQWKASVKAALRISTLPTQQCSDKYAKIQINI